MKNGFEKYFEILVFMNAVLLVSAIYMLMFDSLWW